MAVRFNHVKINTGAAAFAAGSNVRFTKDHEWVSQQANVSYVGITNHAADALGDATFVELPDVGTEVAAGDAASSVESVKSASDVYSPVGGVVGEINQALDQDPGLINRDPMGEGWIFKLEGNGEELEGLMTQEEYVKYVEEEEH